MTFQELMASLRELTSSSYFINELNPVRAKFVLYNEFVLEPKSVALRDGTIYIEMRI